MKKSNAGFVTLGITALIAGIIVYPFIWIYKQVGWFGLIASVVILAIIVFRLLAASKARAQQEAEDEFNDIVLYVFSNNIPTKEARTLNHKYAGTEQSFLLQRLHILRDSIRISLTSKKRATAEDRYSLVLSTYAEIEHDYAHLVSAEAMAEITSQVESTTNRFYTKLCVNEAKAHLDKVEKLKTDKSKQKYLLLAQDTLQQGLSDSRCDQGELYQHMAKVTQTKAVLNL